MRRNRRYNGGMENTQINPVAPSDEDALLSLTFEKGSAARFGQELGECFRLFSRAEQYRIDHPDENEVVLTVCVKWK